MSLKHRISKLYHGYEGANFAFKDGYELAKNDVAQLAKEADELMQEMVNTLAGLDPEHLTPDQQDNLIRVLGKYNAYKEKV